MRRSLLLSLLTLLPLLLALAACSGAPDRGAPPEPAPYDPLARAMASIGQPLTNVEAGIPPQCYTATEGSSNPCWVCHTVGRAPNTLDDAYLQGEYAFSDVGLTNHWTNLFVDRTREARAISSEEILAYIREDDVTPLARALSGREGYPGYVPDLDFERGFDELGFARNGSGWRALRYVPFPGAFYPTNGSSDDVFIRLPRAYRVDASGQPSSMIARINLSILEAAMTGDPDAPIESLVREVEPLDETIAGLDLDGDGALSSETRSIRGLPSHYVGGAASEPVVRLAHPEGTEYLHTVRYVDPDAPDLRSRRVKELRYMRRTRPFDAWATLRAIEDELDERDDQTLPVYPGSPETGYLNAFGWQLQGFIEDADGSLRLQTVEEHRFCMGCHSGIGGTTDSTFSFARKLPALEGWRVQTLAGMRSPPQAGHAEPEVLEYFRRVGGADELRANGEMLARFWPGGVLDEAEVRRVALGGDRDLAWLLAPSRERAIDLARAYRVIVREQSFVRGRDATLSPPAHVHREIREGQEGAAREIVRDGRPQLAW